MSETAAAPNVPDVPIDPGVDDARLEALGYRPQLNRVLGFFENFAVGFTYLSPMVGISSLFILGVALAGPAYIWLTFRPPPAPPAFFGLSSPPVWVFFCGALLWGGWGSHYPVAGALYQYSKFSVGA